MSINYPKLQWYHSIKMRWKPLLKLFQDINVDLKWSVYILPLYILLPWTTVSYAISVTFHGQILNLTFNDLPARA